VQRPNWGEERSSAPRRGRWSQAEIARFRELYGLRDETAIARELNRSVASVRNMADALFKDPIKTGPWADDEVERLKTYLGATSNKTIARILARPVSEVEARIAELSKVQRDDAWTQQEINDLKRLYGTRSDESLAIIFGRSLDSVRECAEKLCIAKDKAFLRKESGGAKSTRMPRWKPEELEILRELYPDSSNLEIAQKLNRSVKSVVSKAHNMGLKKDPARLREMGRENVSLRYRADSDESS